MPRFFGTPLRVVEQVVQQARITDVRIFFKEVQRRKGMFCRVVVQEDGTETREPYDLYDQQVHWLSLYGPKHAKRRALLASRDKGKSQIVTTLGAAWQIYSNPTTKIGVMSFKHENAAKLVDRILEILQAFGVAIQHKNGGYYTKENTDHTPTLMPMGLMSTVRGMHFDYLVMDDPLTVNEQFSKKYIDRSRYFMNEGSSIARRIILIGQLLTRNDLYYDAFGDAGGRYYLLQSWHGDIPELDKDLEYETATMGRKDVARNYLGYIDDEDEAIFQSIQFSEAQPTGDLFAFIDPSAKGNDYTAVAIGWVHEACIIVYGEIFKEHWGNCLDRIAYLVQRCKRVYYEDNHGVALGQFLKERGIRAIGQTTTANKIAKIYGMRGLVVTDRIRISNDMPADAVMQIKDWTQTAEHDDMPDAMAMLVHKMGWRRLTKNESI